MSAKSGHVTGPHPKPSEIPSANGMGDTYTDSLDEGETKNGVREELATEGRVAGNSVDEGGEDETDTNTGTSKTDGGGAHTNVLGDLDKGVGHLGGVGALGDRGAGGLEHVGGALHGVEGSVLAGGSWTSCVSRIAQSWLQWLNSG